MTIHVPHNLPARKVVLSILSAALLSCVSLSAFLPEAMAQQAPPPPNSEEMGQRPIPPEFEGAASLLGITKEALFTAMTNAGGPNADFAKAAAELNIEEDALREALMQQGQRPEGQPPKGAPPPQNDQMGQQMGAPNGLPPEFVNAAKALGITTEALFTAMTNAGGPNANIANAAAELNISEDDLSEILMQGAQASLTNIQSDPDIEAITTFFGDADIVSGPNKVACKLSGGTETNCFSITVRPNPRNYTPGPWCPSNITDGAEKGGIWFVDGKAVDVDGAFITSLSKIYGDEKWKLYDDETGAVKFTGTLEACEAAARPDVDPAYQNHCVQCLPEYMPEDATITYLIPLESVPANQSQPTNQAGSGIASNGVRLDGPAPVDAILSAYTIAPFDDCGGHVNLHVGYHYHAVTDCLSGEHTTLKDVDLETIKTHSGQIGIAMDGHAIFANHLADGSHPEGLDQCQGHEAEGLPYHYHAGEAGSNQIIGCLTAETGCVLAEGQTSCDFSRRPPPPGGQPPRQAPE